jgi:probable HAF family extracellular repeat protein
MSPRFLKFPVSFLTLAALTLPSQLAAQHHRYKLIDIGTFGGPGSFYASEPVVQSVNNGGVVVGGAETPGKDPLAPNCSPISSNCQIVHAFEWRDGVRTDLGTLPSGNNSIAYWVSDSGLVFGNSDDGGVDAITGLQDVEGVVWKNGQIINLGTLGVNFVSPNAMNDRGQVVGFALNAIPDQFSFASFLGVETQVRAFLWQDGVMLDLGTLGGPDGWAASINDGGQIAGWSLVDSTVNSSTGQPTQHPFLWENGRMIDLHTLGGTFAVVGSLQSPGAGSSLNNRGQVIGTSNLLGDSIHHPFLWDRGILTDLGTLGGDNGEAWWINDSGQIVGRADLPGSQVHHAFLWEHGKMIDLGFSPNWPCSTAIDVNSRGQIIIDTGLCGVGGGPGLLWENGHLYDLNKLIPSNTGIVIGGTGGPSFINDRGEIAATGVLSNGDEHAVLLIPCDENHPNIEGCDYSLVDGAASAEIPPPQSAGASSTTSSKVKSTLSGLTVPYRFSVANRHRRIGASPQN